MNDKQLRSFTIFDVDVLFVCLFICLLKSHFDVQSTNTYLHIKHIVIHQTVLNRTTRDYITNNIKNQITLIYIYM